jgi:hypothetical protein
MRAVGPGAPPSATAAVLSRSRGTQRVQGDSDSRTIGVRVMEGALRRPMGGSHLAEGEVTTTPVAQVPAYTSEGRV